MMNENELSDVEYYQLTVHEMSDDEYYEISYVNRYQDDGLDMDEQEDQYYRV